MVKKAVIVGVSVFFILLLINAGLNEYYRSRIIDQSKESVSITTAFAILSSIKIAISDFYSANGKLPENNQELGIGAPEALAERGIKSVTIGPSGRIDAALKGMGDNAHLYLYAAANQRRPGSSLVWRCYVKGVRQAALDTVYSPSCTLLTNNEDPPGPLRQVKTPAVEDLIKAIHAKRNGLVRILIKQQADVNGRSAQGESPLRAAGWLHGSACAVRNDIGLALKRATARLLHDVPANFLRRSEFVVLHGQGDGIHLVVAGILQRAHDIGRVPAGADSEHHVPRLTQSLNLAFEDAIEAKVVGTGRQNRRVGRECDRGQTRSQKILRQHTDELRRQMLAVRCAAPIAAQQQLVVLLQRPCNTLCGCHDVRDTGGDHLLFHRDAVCEMLPDRLRCLVRQMHGGWDHTASLWFVIRLNAAR